MSNTPGYDWTVPADEVEADPWDLDLNTKELVEQDRFLPEPQTDLHLQCISVDTIKSDKPCKRIVFKILEGLYQDYIITDYFYGTKEASWRLRELYVACGFCTTTNVQNADGNYKEVTHVDNSSRPETCIGQCLRADAVKSSSQAEEFYARLKNMRQAT